MRGVLPRAIVLAVVIAVATLAVAWWIVPLIGLAFGFVTARRGWTAAALVPFKAGLLGWGVTARIAALGEGLRRGAGRHTLRQSWMEQR